MWRRRRCRIGARWRAICVTLRVAACHGHAVNAGIAISPWRGMTAFTASLGHRTDGRAGRGRGQTFPSSHTRFVRGERLTVCRRSNERRGQRRKYFVIRRARRLRGRERGRDCKEVRAARGCTLIYVHSRKPVTPLCVFRRPSPAAVSVLLLRRDLARSFAHQRRQTESEAPALRLRLSALRSPPPRSPDPSPAMTA